jgi:hypothetical protein
MEDVFAASRCHVLSSDSGSGWLKHAARLRNKSPITVFTFSRLIYSAGPISGTTNPSLYSNWCDQFAPGLRSFSGLDHAGYIADIEQAWAQLLAWSGPVTFWFSSKNIQESSFYLGFLQSYPRLDSVEFVDVSRLGRSNRTITATGECSEDLLEAAWFDRYHLSPEDLKRELRKCSDHFEAGSGIRVFEDGQLISAPFEFHDAAILEQLDRDWACLADVIGNLFAADQRRDARHLEYFYLLWRVKMLAIVGKLDCSGDFEEGDLRASKIRIL